MSSVMSRFVEEWSGAARRSGFGMIWRCPVSRDKFRRFRLVLAGFGWVRSDMAVSVWSGLAGLHEVGQGGRRMARHV